MSKSILDEVLKWTNAEGRRVSGEKWKVLDRNELYSLLGLLILSGVFKSHNEHIRELWSPKYGGHCSDVQ